MKKWCGQSSSRGVGIGKNHAENVEADIPGMRGATRNEGLVDFIGNSVKSTTDENKQIILGFGGASSADGQEKQDSINKDVSGFFDDEVEVIGSCGWKGGDGGKSKNKSSPKQSW